MPLINIEYDNNIVGKDEILELKRVFYFIWVYGFLLQTTIKTPTQLCAELILLLMYSPEYRISVYIKEKFAYRCGQW